MKKNLKYISIAIIFLPLLYIMIKISLIGIEKHIEKNVHNIVVYNLTDDYIDIFINNKLINVEGKTKFSDKIFNKNRIYNYIFKIYGKIILEKEVIFPSEECGSYSAIGGTFSRITIKNNDNNNYDIRFFLADSEEPPFNEIKKLKYKDKKRFIDIFNKDGLNMN